MRPHLTPERETASSPYAQRLPVGERKAAGRAHHLDDGTLATAGPTGLAGILPSEASGVIAVRFIAYTFAVFGFTVSLPSIVGEGDIVVFKEGGPIEWSQFVALSLASLAFCTSALARARLQDLSILLALFTSAAAMRELDSPLATLIPYLGWKLPVVLLAVTAATLTWRRRPAMETQLRRFLAYRSFPLLWAGFVVAIPFAQLVGHDELLRLVMGDDYTRDYKRVIEETTELLGYTLILIGSIEFLWQAKRDRFRPARPHARSPISPHETPPKRAAFAPRSSSARPPHSAGT